MKYIQYMNEWVSHEYTEAEEKGSQLMIHGGHTVTECIELAVEMNGVNRPTYTACKVCEGPVYGIGTQVSEVYRL